MFKIIALLFILISCAEIQQNLNPDIYYKRDMLLEVNGVKGSGTLVVPQNSPYTFNIEAKGALDMLDFQTCHRDIIKEKAGNGGIFGNDKKAKIDYIPVSGIEDTGDCDIIASGYNIKGKHSWAYLAIESSKYTLPAFIKCDGSMYNSRGLTICQAKTGLEEKIEFASQVGYIPQKNCPVKTEDDKNFTFFPNKGECVIIFKSKISEKFHRLVIIGFESVLVRE
jgi:hypothetical protein